MRVAAE
ncbi:hypothetical protein Tco_0208292, partial [Tanacetum coccineum]